MKLRHIAIALCVAVGACDAGPPGGDDPQHQIYVLIDLSETWHNPANLNRNQQTVREIGAGIAEAATDLAPVSIQYRIIGDQSYERDPVCDVDFIPSLIQKSNDQRRIGQPRKLENYLMNDCTNSMLAKPPEQKTEITAAIRSVMDQPRDSTTDRTLIIASDFLEESPGGIQLSSSTFRATKVLLLYRPLAEDQAKPSDTIARVAAWKARLANLGADVEVAPDTALRRSWVANYVAKSPQQGSK